MTVIIGIRLEVAYENSAWVGRETLQAGSPGVFLTGSLSGMSFEKLAKIRFSADRVVML